MSIQFSEVFDNLKQDPEWIQTCLIMGLLFCVPIAGQINLLGWCLAVCHGRLQGEARLPPASLDYIAGGLTLFLAYLGIGVFVGVCSNIPVLVGGSSLSALSGLLSFVFVLAFVFFQPAIVYVVYKDNRATSAFDPARLLQIYKQNPSLYFSFFGLVLGSSIFASLGLVACFFGILFTFPVATAFMGIALAFFVEDSTQEGQPLA